MTRLFTTALGSAAMLLGLFAALLLTAGVITLIGAFLPNAGMAAMGILIAPWLLLFGGAGLVAARGTWRRQRGSQISGIVFALVLALATGAAGLSALGIGRGTSSTTPCTGGVADKCVAAVRDTEPVVVDLASGIPLLVIAGLSLTTIVLLLIVLLGGGSPPSLPPTHEEG